MGEKEEDGEGNEKRLLHLIVSFDVAREAFTLIPFPPMTSVYCYFNTLAGYEEKLAVFFPRIDFSETYMIELWVLEECTYPSRERWSWTKIYTSKPIPEIVFLIPEIIWRNEIVFSMEESEYPIEGEEKENHETEVVLCNLTTGEFNLFDIGRCNNGQQIIGYVESLVLLDNIHI